MITNERQLKITRAQAARFEKALAEMEQRQEEGVSPLLRRAERDALASQRESLRSEIAEYEALRGGKRQVFEASSFEELPRLLIQARIARGMTQKDLAERLGLKEQQVQRYEGTGYASASLSRLRQVVEALEVQVRETVTLNEYANSKHPSC
jgi:Predicted transcriptional regulator with C-terminal CBS domains